MYFIAKIFFFFLSRFLRIQVSQESSAKLHQIALNCDSKLSINSLKAKYYKSFKGDCKWF